MQKLTKAWNKAPAGTPITADPAEKRKTKGAVLVDEARMAHLVKHGFFRARKVAEEEKPDVKIIDDPVRDTPPPSSVLTLDKLAEKGKNVTDRRFDMVLDREPSPSPYLDDPDDKPKGSR